MKRSLHLLFGVALIAFLSQTAVLGLSVHEVEQMAFDDAYRLWRRELESARKQVSAQGFWFLPTGGSTDPRTGRFTPSIFAALTCRLGQDAHLHEPFLRKELISDAYVSLILETSSILCQRCRIDSQAHVVIVPGRGYVDHAFDAWVPESRQKLWLEAFKKTDSQPNGPANGSQPIRSETNRTSGAAGSRR